MSAEARPRQWYPRFASKRKYQEWAEQQAVECAPGSGKEGEWTAELVDPKLDNAYILTDGNIWYSGKGHNFYERRQFHLKGTGASTTRRMVKTTTDPLRVLWYIAVFTGFHSRHEALAFESRLKHTKLQPGMSFDTTLHKGIKASCDAAEQHHRLQQILYKACTLNRFSPKLPIMYDPLAENKATLAPAPQLTIHWFEPQYRGVNTPLPLHVRERNVSEREKRAIYALRTATKTTQASLTDQEEEIEEDDDEDEVSRGGNSKQNKRTKRN